MKMYWRLPWAYMLHEFRECVGKHHRDAIAVGRRPKDTVCKRCEARSRVSSEVVEEAG